MICSNYALTMAVTPVGTVPSTRVANFVFLQTKHNAVREIDQIDLIDRSDRYLVKARQGDRQK